MLMNGPTASCNHTLEHTAVSASITSTPPCACLVRAMPWWSCQKCTGLNEAHGVMCMWGFGHRPSPVVYSSAAAASGDVDDAVLRANKLNNNCVWCVVVQLTTIRHAHHTANTCLGHGGRHACIAAAATNSTRAHEHANNSFRHRRCHNGVHAGASRANRRSYNARPRRHAVITAWTGTASCCGRCTQRRVPAIATHAHLLRSAHLCAGPARACSPYHTSSAACSRPATSGVAMLPVTVHSRDR